MVLNKVYIVCVYSGYKWGVLSMDKKGTFDMKNPKGIMVAIILAVVSISLLAGLLPSLVGLTINMSLVPSMPLATLFAAGGAVVLLIGAAVVFAFVKLFLGGKK